MYYQLPPCFTWDKLVQIIELVLPLEGAAEHHAIIPQHARAKARCVHALGQVLDKLPGTQRLSLNEISHLVARWNQVQTGVRGFSMFTSQPSKR